MLHHGSKYLAVSLMSGRMQTHSRLPNSPRQALPCAQKTQPKPRPNSLPNHDEFPLSLHPHTARVEPGGRRYHLKTILRKSALGLRACSKQGRECFENVAICISDIRIMKKGS